MKKNLSLEKIKEERRRSRTDKVSSLIKKTIADDLSDYSELASKLQLQERENLSSLIISALENAAQIEDNRSDYY